LADAQEHSKGDKVCDQNNKALVKQLGAVAQFPPQTAKEHKECSTLIRVAAEVGLRQ
jgi:hypothetical protein